MNVRLADFVMQTLVSSGIRQAFLVTGGGAMHLNDAIGRAEGLAWLPCHHEQACAIAAQGFARLTGTAALVQVTTGPGSTNALTGVYGAFVDSLPMIVVSGQVKRETLMETYDIPGLRQLGDQEVNAVALASPITKYAVCVTDPLSIRYHLERALFEAMSGRPGPVWLDIPVDVQSAMIDPSQLSSYAPSTQPEEARLVGAALRMRVDDIVQQLRLAQRPVFYFGAGVRLAGAAPYITKLADQFGIPMVTGFNAHDLLPSAHPCYAGRPGTIGDRSGNFAVQNADCVVVIGCRLNIRQISYNWKAFARHARLILVDIDAAELRKPTLSPYLTVQADARDVLQELLAAHWERLHEHETWREWCVERRERYPVVLPEYWRVASPVNPYCFADALSSCVSDDEIVVTGDGTACITTFQGFRVRTNDQRLFSDSGSAPMGFDLPAAIGASVASGRRVVCIAGDGSLMMNLQELQTLAGHRIPVKLFIFNNDGYLSIKLTQKGFFGGHYVGAHPASGVTFPDFGKVASAFGLPYRRVTENALLAEAIAATLEADGPCVCEVVLDPEQAFSPRVTSRRLEDGTMVTAPLEDMFPFLSRDEFSTNMLVPFDQEA